MVYLSVDTQKDSKETIRHVIALLQRELDSSVQPQQGMATQSSPSASQLLSEDLTSLEQQDSSQENEPSTPSSPSSPTPPTTTPSSSDPFAMFDEQPQPSSAPKTSTQEDYNIDKDGAIPMVTSIHSKPRQSQGIVNLDGLSPRPEPRDSEDSARFAKQVKREKKRSEAKAKKGFYDLEMY